MFWLNEEISVKQESRVNARAQTSEAYYPLALASLLLSHFLK